MRTRITVLLALWLATGIAIAIDDPVDETTEAQTDAAAGELVADAGDDAAPAETGPKTLSGMSVLGNREAPKALVIVPWKSSDPGERLAVSRTLDEGPLPVDRDVFVRQLDYYRIGVESWEGAQPASQ